MYALYVPADTQSDIPEGAALVECGRGRVCVYWARDESYAECCAQAVKRGRVIAIPEGAIMIGMFSPADEEVRLQANAISMLERWLRRRVYRNELKARDNRDERRRQARHLTMQGRTAEAWKLDRRLGL